MSKTHLTESYFHKCHRLLNEMSRLKKSNMALEIENHELKKDVKKWKEKYRNSEMTVIYEYSTSIKEDLKRLEEELEND